jgi:hypothetical protein
MTTQSLFGTLATRFSTQPENLATESLFYILNASRTAERAFLGYVARAGVNLGDNLLFQTQSHGKDKSIPDLVGVNAANEQVLVIESKFWASLTDNQPITYLDRLPKEKPGILLFIAPERRFPTLWAELLERLNRNEKPFQKSETDDGLLVVRLNAHHVMALVSWRAVLAIMEQSATAAQEMQVVSDIRQLSGLCERMDSAAFIPLQSEDLSSKIGMRLQQYYGLVEDVVKTLQKENLAKRRNPSGGTWGYGRFFTFFGYEAYFGVNVNFWAKYRETPFWLQLRGLAGQGLFELKEKLQYLEHENPPRLFLEESWYTIPLHVPMGVERKVVLDSLLAQLREIAKKIKD